mmetsp:Transcript_3704/g.8941  ORF Transcript_3704/g.8941 Transcript_3704/m.8941 type:complete len:104 (-) Transcript_3704:291-602(-)
MRLFLIAQHYLTGFEMPLAQLARQSQRFHGCQQDPVIGTELQRGIVQLGMARKSLCKAALGLTDKSTWVIGRAAATLHKTPWPLGQSFGRPPAPPVVIYAWTH